MTYKKADRQPVSTHAGIKGQIAVRPRGNRVTVLAIIADLGDTAAKRFLELFTAIIRNKERRTCTSS
jgi:hypothetical protein